ncbi:MAG: tryptophan synthase subunit alpha [Solirubrobacterales bacterium]
MSDRATGPSGLERIAIAFERARGEGRAALMPYLMGGYPDLETSRAVARAYARAGADLIELGAPYSDPLADGPTIHAAATEALRAGTTLDDVLGVCAEISAEVPVLPMVYANMALSRGAERFAEDLADAGACGAIIPDLPPSEDAELPGALAERGLTMIPFVTPTTSPTRRKRIAGDARGFIYIVSLTGVTGERGALPGELEELVRVTREAAEVPCAVGFGISTPERAAEVGALADGVIIGSRLVRVAGEAADADAAADQVREFIESCLAAMAPAEAA